MELQDRSAPHKCVCTEPLARAELETCCMSCCRTILDIPEMTGDFWRFFQQHWGPRVAAGQARIGLFNSQDGA